MSKSLSKQILKKCGYKPEVIQDYELNDIQAYPDLKAPENFVLLIEKLIPFMGMGDGIEFYNDGVYIGGCINIETTVNENKLDFRDKLLSILINFLKNPKDEQVQEITKVLAQTKWKV